MRAPGRNDIELLCVVLFWAFNVSVVKVALHEMEPLAFNILRFLCASVLLLALTRWLEGSVKVAYRDLGRMILLGAVGHTMYQLCFVLGLARTTASSTALIFGSAPILVGLLSRLAGHERIGVAGAGGALLAFFGVYLIVGSGGETDSGTGGGTSREMEMTGDLLVLGAVVCWSIYTVASREMLERYSPLRVTAVSMALGTILMVPSAISQVQRQEWASVSALTWAGLAYSFLFALSISYVLWYRSVKKVGNLRTAIYSNLVPVFGTLFGVWLLDDQITAGLGAGGACILGGIILTRLRGTPLASAARPSETGSARP